MASGYPTILIAMLLPAGVLIHHCAFSRIFGKQAKTYITHSEYRSTSEMFYFSTDAEILDTITPSFAAPSRGEDSFDRFRFPPRKIEK